jgi:ferredoxin
MKITVDANLCSGHGRCYTLSPDLFTSDDEGFCAERGQTLDVPSGHEDSARLAVASCPEGAISVSSA